MTFPAPLKLTLVTHGLTSAQREARFPSDEPLVDAAAQSAYPRADFIFTAPELRARQTIADNRAEVDEELRDLNCGSWAGKKLDDVRRPDLLRWLTDPDFVPPDGESVSQLCERVAAWLDHCSGRDGRIVVVTHPAVVRAAIVTALQAPLGMFWRIDVGPLTQTRFRYRNGWTVRIGEPSARRE